MVQYKGWKSNGEVSTKKTIFKWLIWDTLIVDDSGGKNGTRIMQFVL